MWPEVTIRLIRVSSLPRGQEISDHFTPNWMRETRREIYLGSEMAWQRQLSPKESGAAVAAPNSSR
jgi:hypothetical protein